MESVCKRVNARISSAMATYAGTKELESFWEEARIVVPRGFRQVQLVGTDGPPTSEVGGMPSSGVAEAICLHRRCDTRIGDAPNEEAGI